MTLAKDKPFEFLDHAIRCGDSLVGLHDIAQLRHFSLKPDDDDAVLFKGPLDEVVDEAITLRLKLEDLPANTVEDVQRQEKLLIEANEKIARLRCAADLLVAAEFWGESAKDKLERVRHAAVKSGHYVEKGPTEEFEQVADKERKGQTMFHWPLEFPEVIIKRVGFDAFVGNPPFMGGKKISGQFGTPYRELLVEHLADGSKGNADICSYFFLRASQLTRLTGAFGFVATNTICQGDTREVGLDEIVANGYSVIRATPSATWPGNASVQVATVWAHSGRWSGECSLNGRIASRISSYLTEPGILEGPPKRLLSNAKQSYQGAIILGTGFTMEPHEAAALISEDSKYADVLFPFLNGVDLNTSPTQQARRWVINFFDWPLSHQDAPVDYDGPVASDYPACLDIVRTKVKPERDLKDRKVYREVWWKYAERQTALYAAIADLKNVIVVAATSKTLAFTFASTECLFSNALYVFCSEDPALFATLMSEFKRSWTFEYCSNMRTDLRYSNSDAYETFPFPRFDSQLTVCGLSYSDYRAEIMAHRSEGLTAIYNRFSDREEFSSDIKKLRELHVKMDQAVAAAYGWSDLDLGHGFHDTKQGVRFTISEPARREVLQRLLKLNHERYAEEVKQGLHSKKKGTAKKARTKRKASSGPTLFGDDDDEPDAARTETGGASEKPLSRTSGRQASDSNNGEAATGSTPIDEFDTEDIMAAFRQAARGRGPLERDELLKEVSVVLGYQRLGPKIEETLRGQLRAAIRRRIIDADGVNTVRAGTVTMADYSLEELRDTFRSVMRKGGNYERDDVVHFLARYLGFARVTDTSRDAIKSAINSAIRQRILGYEGSLIWREE